MTNASLQYALKPCAWGINVKSTTNSNHGTTTILRKVSDLGHLSQKVIHKYQGSSQNWRLHEANEAFTRCLKMLNRED